MKSRDFCYWLQGMFELVDPDNLSEKQTDLIKKHLAMVFIHEIDPSMGDKTHQGKLNSIHNGSFQDTSQEQGSNILNTPQRPMSHLIARC